ncbi:hypothetical protein [Planctomicrobium piriforme]|uniref:Leucine Rich repeats (2 copies) n=1 Tax=Planctomicrobium piriforme TaxID=1576369 RepID=A0A1I3SAD6_9PLAN|nr:hypothetical protein [Planctomicrobium piriforme]SFJ54507.1 hypothetical protein SAMN05421753_12342 [Planctomicrobium piriforme]
MWTLHEKQEPSDRVRNSFLSRPLAFGFLLCLLLLLVISAWNLTRLQRLEKAIRMAGGEFRNPNRFDASTLPSLFQTLQATFRSGSRKPFSLVLLGSVEESDWISDYGTDLRKLPEVELTLKNYKHTAKLLQTLEGSDNIVSLYVFGTPLSEDILRSISRQRNLTLLYINHCTQADGSIKYLKDLDRLEHLVLIRTPINEQDVRSFQDLVALKRLGIDSATVSPNCVDNLAACRTLEKLAIIDATDDTIKDMSSVSWNCILLFFANDITSQCIPDLARMSLAKELHVAGSKISASDIEHAEVSLANVRLRAAIKLPE